MENNASLVLLIAKYALLKILVINAYKDSMSKNYISKEKKLATVLKPVVMEEDFNWIVMMEIKEIMMDVIKIVLLKVDIHAKEDLV